MFASTTVRWTPPKSPPWLVFDRFYQKIIGSGGQPDIGICVAEVSDGFICGGGLYDSGNMKPALVKLAVK